MEVKCEVDASGFRYTNILEAVPEGTYVEPGDFLVQLDSSPFEELLTEQTILCTRYEAALIQAETRLETTKISLDEYIGGLLPQDRLELGIALDRAEEKLREATQTLLSSQSMFRRGFITQTVRLDANLPTYALQALADD